MPIKYLNEKGSLRKNAEIIMTKSIDSAVKIGCAIFKFVFDKTKPQKINAEKKLTIDNKINTNSLAKPFEIMSNSESILENEIFIR